jgi:hypothetical protein
MSRRHLLTSAAGVRYTWEDQADGTYLIHGTQDLTDVLDDNKAKANHNDGYSKSREMRRVAHIPFIIRNKWMAEEGWDCFDHENADLLMRKLNDPDWRYLRTADGRLGISNGVMR